MTGKQTLRGARRPRGEQKLTAGIGENKSTAKTDEERVGSASVSAMTLATGYTIVDNVAFVRLEALVGEDACPIVAFIAELVPFGTLWAQIVVVLKF
jgi:hypothetical protein